MPFSKEMILGASGNQGGAGFYEYQIERSARFDYGSYTSLHHQVVEI